MSLVDQYGNQISSRSFLKASENGGGRVPPQSLRIHEPLRKRVTQREWQVISYLSEKAFGNFPLVEGIISQKAMHAIGNAWLPVFQGEAVDWGEMVRRWLIEEWYPTCDVRGMNFGFVDNLYLGSSNIDSVGDLVELLVESENGWPMIQMIPSRQIGQWEAGSGDRVKGGPYDGARIENGVIMNDSGRPIAYRKLGEERGSFEDIEARYIIHTFEPKYIEQTRGFPLLTSCLEDLAMSSQSEEWEQMAMLIASSIGLIDTNESGESDTAADNPFSQNTENTPAGVQVTSMLGGMIRYLKANAGHKLEQFTNQKPGDDWENYQDRIARKAAVAANWSYGYAWKPESITGTAQRGELVKCRNSVSDRQSLIGPRAKRKVGFAVSVAIKNGIIPPYPGRDKGGFLKWGFTLPPRISIDEGRDRAQRREDSKFGLILDSTIVEEDGNTTYKDFCLQRARDAAIREKARQQIEKEEGITIDPREMRMWTPNDQAQGQQQENPPTQ